MSISGVSSSSAYDAWLAYMQSQATSNSTKTSQTSGGSTTDSASMSAQGFAALLQDLGSSAAPSAGSGGQVDGAMGATQSSTPGMSDAQAAHIGSQLQARRSKTSSGMAAPRSELSTSRCPMCPNGIWTR